jgi:small-conductance mechanosensitive channel
LDKIIYAVYFNNTILNYFIFLTTLIIGIAVIKIVEHMVKTRFIAWAGKGKFFVDDQLILSSVKKIILILYWLAFRFSAKILNLNTMLEETIKLISIAFSIAIGAMLLSSLLLFFIGNYIKNKIDGENRNNIYQWINRMVELVIWSIALILFLDNIGIQITSLVTGLGIGGVALAFAAQAILVDLFCSFTIFFDKPFEIGDFIIVGDQMGTVEYIGMKTTRLRALSGEQLVLANSDLTKSRIQNYKTMAERRVLFKLGVTYDTELIKLKEIPAVIKNIISNVPQTRFGRAHFCAYGAYSLDYEIVYYVLSSDFDIYMDINQEIYFQIKAEFEQRGIEFAFPTQTVQMYNQVKA